MWQKPKKKTIFLLNVGGYDRRITDMTYPLIYFYAEKIGASIHVIRERRFPDWPVVYEKLQIYELAQEMNNDWNIYIDSDALIHPETIDWTEHIPRDTVAHNGSDMAGIRWRYDRFFQRDGRNIGSCDWFTIASDLCVELWKPLDDITQEEALANILPTVSELAGIITKEHLIDDYVLSRNIAKYGLKFKTFSDVLSETRLVGSDLLFHVYTLPTEEKIIELKKVLERWKIGKPYFDRSTL